MSDRLNQWRPLPAERLPMIKVAETGVWSAYPFSAGRLAAMGQGVMRWSVFMTAVRGVGLLPESFEMEMDYQIGGGTDTDDEYERVITARDGDVYITIDEQNKRLDCVVWSPDLSKVEAVESVMAYLKSHATPIPVATDELVDTSFWRLTPDGPSAKLRRLEVPTWDSISGNYAPAAKKSLAELMGMDNTTHPPSGNIVVLHGPAGTGKTTALRALAKAWQPWADTHYIVDPDAFLDHADYMWQALLARSDYEDERWKLVIMEDVDELIKTGAKEKVGQAFSRLLNLGDGFLGQGLRVILVLTTNEPLGTLSPAISRPGRCLAHVEVPKFNPTESLNWLHTNGYQGNGTHGDSTLAELYEEISTEHQVVAEQTLPMTGKYL